MRTAAGTPTPPCLITCTEDLLPGKEVAFSHNPLEVLPHLSSTPPPSMFRRNLPFFSTRPNSLHL